MTVVKPSSNHPWRANIQKDVEEMRIKKRIDELEAHIKVLKTEIKMNRKRLDEISGGTDGR